MLRALARKARRRTIVAPLPMMGTVLFALLLSVSAGAAPVRPTAVVVMPLDASGDRAAAETGARLRERVRHAPALRWVDPARALSGDPTTREELALERAEAALADGKKAYDALVLDDAIARLAQAAELFRQTGPLLGDLSGLKDALAHLGAALVLRGSAAEAEATFLDLLALDPSFVLDGFPPTVSDVFDRATAALDRRPSGQVEVFSAPAYAAVYLDGRFEGVTPVVLDGVFVGEHHLRIEQAGRVAYAEAIAPDPDTTLTVQANLRPIAKAGVLGDLSRAAATEIGRPQTGGQTRELARILGAEVLIAVRVSQSGRDVSLEGHVVDVTQDAPVALERAVLGTDALATGLDPFLSALVSAAVAPPSTGPAFGLGDTSSGWVPGQGTQSLATDPSDGRKKERDAPGEVYLGWTLVGLGGVSMVTGAVFGILALETHNDFRKTAQTSPDLPGIQSQGRTFSVAADALLIGGGVAVAGGAALVLLSEVVGGPNRRLEGVRAGVTPVPGGAVVGLGGSF